MRKRVTHVNKFCNIFNHCHHGVLTIMIIIFKKKDVNEAYIISIDQLKSFPAKKREELIGVFFFLVEDSEPWSYGTLLCMFLFSYSDNIFIKNCLFL